MWKCPNCETVNDAEKCIVCGEAKPIFSSNNGNANYANGEPVQSMNPVTPVVPAAPVAPAAPKAPEVKKSNAWIYVVVIVATLCLLAGIATVILLRQKAYDDEDDRERPAYAEDAEYVEEATEAKAEEAAEDEEYEKAEEAKEVGAVEQIDSNWAKDTVIISGKECWSKEFEETVEYCREFTLEMFIADVKSGNPYGTWYVYLRDGYGKWRKVHGFYYNKGDASVETVVSARGGAFDDFDAVALVQQSSGDANFSYRFECSDFLIDYYCDTVSFDNYEADEVKEHRYSVYLSDSTWEDANRYARNQGGYLACINSKEEFDKICKMADDAGIRVLWVGAKKTGSYWSDTGWIDGTRMTFTKWLENEPSYYDEYGNSENYLVILKRDGEWYFNDEINDIGGYDYITGRLGYIIEFDK